MQHDDTFVNLSGYVDPKGTEITRGWDLTRSSAGMMGLCEKSTIALRHDLPRPAPLGLSPYPSFTSDEIPADSG